MTSNDPPEQNKTRRRRWSWVLTVGGTGLLLAAGLWIVLQATVAGIVQDTILEYAARNSIAGLTLDVRQITPWHADIHALQIGRSASEDSLRVDSLALDYNPAGLKAHVIKRITLSGLYLRLVDTPEGWAVAGLPPRLLTSAAGPGDGTSGRRRPDWQIKHLEIRNSRLDIRQGSRHLIVPFEFQAYATDPTADRYQGHLVCHPWDQALPVAFDLNLAEQQLALEGAAEALDLRRVVQGFAPQTDLDLQGRLAITYQARLALAPLALAKAKIQFRLPDTINLRGPLALRALNPNLPLLTVRSGANRTWEMHAPGLEFSASDRLQVTDWNGRLVPAAAGWQWEGELDLAFQPTAAGPRPQAEDPGPNTMPLTYQGEWQPTGRWSMALDGRSARWSVELDHDGNPIAQKRRLRFTPRLRVRATGQNSHLRIEGTAHLADFKGSLPDMEVRIPAVVLQAKGQGAFRQFTGQYDLRADDFRLTMRRLNARLPRLSVKGAFTAENDRLRLSGQTRFSRAAIRLPGQQIRLQGLRLRIPFTWPYVPSTAAGTLALASATWKDIALGAARGQIRQQATGAVFKMTHASQVIPGGQLKIKGRLDATAGSVRPLLDIDYQFARAASPDDVDLGLLMPALAGTQFNGRIQAKGRGTYRSGRMAAALQLTLDNGRLVLPEQKSGLVGLKGAIEFPDLLQMRTAPRQQLFFERAYIGDIAVTDGRLDFQIEPGGVFFLEQSRFQWCRGTVYLPATRIIPGEEAYDLTLWCDRLKLASLLEQLGAARAEGGGTVSGRIPIRFRKGQVFVDNGFLYSSPGDGGIIHLHGTEMLTAGIPPGTPQYTQLELARQALKEYDYRWVKLSLATAPEEDLLLLKLQLDGKPAKPLPFIYDPQAGGFVPAGPDSKGSHFQGISLDVNFSLPLNRLLEYKNLLKLFS
ncbi:MAG: YdbH domain-containing protein [Desulfosarcina sp.]|nr:YdbH domain-containing protein [Desulfobacterales bacterium]